MFPVSPFSISKVEGRLPSSHQYGAQQNWRLPPTRHLTMSDTRTAHSQEGKVVLSGKDGWTHRPLRAVITWTKKRETITRIPGAVPAALLRGSLSSLTCLRRPQEVRSQGKGLYPLGDLPVQCCTKISPLGCIFFWGEVEIYSAGSSRVMGREPAF